MTTHRERTWYGADPGLEEAAHLHYSDHNPPSPSRPMGSTCATTRANKEDMAGEPRSPMDKPAFSYRQVLHWSIWSFRIQTSTSIWWRTILWRFLHFHELLLPRGWRFLHTYRQHPPRHPEHASRIWTTPGRATKMEPGPRHYSTRAETRYNNIERQHQNHDAVLEHRVRPTSTSSLGEFLPNLSSKFLFALLIYSFLLFYLKEKNLENPINISCCIL